MLGAAVLGGLACGKPSPPPAASADTVGIGRPADSLVATAPGRGRDLVHTRPERQRRGRGGAPRERSRSVAAPPGFPSPCCTPSAAPEVVNDTTFRARLSDHCKPGDTYLVDFRTGRPVREHK